MEKIFNIFSIINIIMEKIFNIFIPMCGTASRIGGIPKFLLPISNVKSLLLLTLEKVYNQKHNIFISTLPMYSELVYNYTIDYKPNIITLKTETMSETIKKYDFMANNYNIYNVMVMPDTYISDKIPFDTIKNYMDNDTDIVLCLWKITPIQKGKLGQCLLDENNNVINVVDKDPNCEYEYAWGILSWNHKYWSFIDNKKSHIGLSLNDAIKNNLKVKGIIMNGTYNDCGTIDEYKSIL